MTQPNIPELLVVNQASQILQTFGLNALKQKFYNFGKPQNSDSGDKYSMLGTPVFDTVTLYGNETNNDISYYDLGLQKKVTVPKFTIDVALVTCNKIVNVSKTDVIGTNGSVKQYINLGDYSIEIRGVLTSENPNTRPEDAIRALHRITSSTSEINIGSNYLNLFGVNCIVFSGEQTFSQDEGNRDVQKFTLNCLSETPFAIKVTQQGSTTSNTQPK